MAVAGSDKRESKADGDENVPLLSTATRKMLNEAAKNDWIGEDSSTRASSESQLLSGSKSAGQSKKLNLQDPEVMKAVNYMNGEAPHPPI